MNIDPGYFVAILFWASIVGSIVLMILGIARHLPRLLFVGAFVSLPFALVMALYPWGLFMLLVPVGHLLAAYSFRPPRLILRIAALGLVAIPCLIFVSTLFVAPIPTQ